MPDIFWKGKLSLPMRLMVNTSNIIAWVTGNARNTAAMKQRVKLGYEGTYSTDITKYDTVGTQHYNKIANQLLQGLDIQSKEAIDIGCGTGIVSLALLKEGAEKVTCGDISDYMLSQCKNKLASQGYQSLQVDFRTLDAEHMPFADSTFDLAVSSMVFGMILNKSIALGEILRTLRPSGLLAIATQGPEYYAEVIEAAFRVIPKRYVFGYRIEFFPLKEKQLQQMLTKAGFVDVKTRRLTWQDRFQKESEIYDFFTSTSSAWWYYKLPSDKIAEIANKTKRYLERKKINELTQDIVLATGRKPG
jgi:ubiquinone/menaquinone biosynthesis C-methylase UbiE